MIASGGDCLAEWGLAAMCGLSLPIPWVTATGVSNAVVFLAYDRLATSLESPCQSTMGPVIR